MENEEMLEQTNETENAETLTAEENVEGIELTDTAETEDAPSEEEKEKVKMFTQEEVNEMIRKRVAREKREHEKELSKYKNVEQVLNAGLGTHSIEEAETNLRSYYKEQGIEVPEIKNGLSDRDLQLLGNGDADDILELGLEEAEAEANRLAQKGRANWTAREEAEFNKLASTLSYENQKKELKTIGADVSILDSKEFKEFSSKFNYGTSIKDIYNLYSKTHEPKENKNIEKMGSMKNTNDNTTVKDFYSYEESLKFTKKDFDNNPALFKAVSESMTKW